MCLCVCRSVCLIVVEYTFFELSEVCNLRGGKGKELNHQRQQTFSSWDHLGCLVKIKRKEVQENYTLVAGNVWYGKDFIVCVFLMHIIQWLKAAW